MADEGGLYETSPATVQAPTPFKETISDVATALKSPVNGFDIFTFAPGEATHEAVLDASEIDDANQQIMARFHIPYDHVLSSAVVQESKASPQTQVVRK